MLRFATPCAILLTTLAVTGSAQAALPDGWAADESPQPSADRAMLGCCGFDASCCPAAQAQVSIDNAVEDQVAMLPLKELPLAEAQTASFGMGDEGGLRFYDGHGRPLSRLNTKPAENWVRVVPFGVAGRIAVGERGTFWSNSRAFYEIEQERQLGYGVEYPWSSSIPGVLPVLWQGVSHHDGGVRLQSVVGTLDRFAGTVETDELIDTPLAAVGRIFAYRTRRDGETRVHVLVPNGSVAYTSARVGASELAGRFFLDAAFRDLTFPADGDGASAGLDTRFSSRHWALAMPGADATFEGRIHISVAGDRIVVATTSSG